MAMADAGPVFFESATAWRAWLEEQHAAAPEILVGFHRKSTIWFSIYIPFRRTTPERTTARLNVSGVACSRYSNLLLSHCNIRKTHQRTKCCR